MIRRHVRFSSSNRSVSIKSWKDRLSGVPAFILGNGNSILDHDISLLYPYFTIGINRIFLRNNFDPTILFWQDIELWYTDRKQILPLQCMKVCSNTADPQNRFFHFSINSERYKLADYPHELFGKGSTGPLAVQFARCLGCNPIVLIGFDCKTRGFATDFYGRNRHHKNHTLRNCEKGLEWITNNVTDRQIISCSDNDYFENRKLIDVLTQIPSLNKHQRNYWSTLLS